MYNEQGRLNKNKGSKIFVLPSIIINPMASCLKKRALVVKWCGEGGNEREIIEWLENLYPGKISVRPL